MKNNMISIIVIVGIIITVTLMVVVQANAEGNISTDGVFDLATDENFNKEEVLQEGYPTMIDVGGAECIPCKAMAPTLEKLNEELKGKAIIKFVDVNKYTNLRSQFTFQYIPTQFFYDEHGELQHTHSGQISEEEILEIFKEMGYEF